MLAKKTSNLWSLETTLGFRINGRTKPFRASWEDQQIESQGDSTILSLLREEEEEEKEVPSIRDAELPALSHRISVVVHHLFSSAPSRTHSPSADREASPDQRSTIPSRIARRPVESKASHHESTSPASSVSRSPRRSMSTANDDERNTVLEEWTRSLMNNCSWRDNERRSCRRALSEEARRRRWGEDRLFSAFRVTRFGEKEGEENIDRTLDCFARKSEPIKFLEGENFVRVGIHRKWS